MDYVAIGRKVVVVEPIPDGQLPFFDNDIEEFYATKVAGDGTTRMHVLNATRVMVDEFELMVKPKIPYKELRGRKYKMLDRAKERLKHSLALREDNLWFGLFHTAAVATNTEQVVTTGVTKDVLAMGFNHVESHRLVVGSIIMHPQGVSGIRRWNWNQVDETARIEIRERGYLGRLWNANFFISNLVSVDTSDNSYIYILAQPQFVAWNPIRADGEVIPADRPDDALLGWVGYELMGMYVHNNRGVARCKYSTTSTSALT